MPTSKHTEAALAKQLIAGTQKHLGSVSSLMLASGTYSPAQVEAQLLALATLQAEVDAAEATVKVKRTAAKAQRPALHAFLIAYVAFLKTAFSKSPDVLADFGLQPRKVPAPMTTEQRAAAAAKRKATRQARGTRGKKALKAIKGNVTGIELIPVTTPEAAAASATTQTAPSAPGAPPTGSASK